MLTTFDVAHEIKAHTYKQRNNSVTHKKTQVNKKMPLAMIVSRRDFIRK
jgi:hypothetical protein